MRLLSNLHVKGKPAVLPDRAIRRQSHYFIYRPRIVPSSLQMRRGGEGNVKTHTIQFHEIYQQLRKYIYPFNDVTPFFYHFNRTGQYTTNKSHITKLHILWTIHHLIHVTSTCLSQLYFEYLNVNKIQHNTSLLIQH